MEKKAKKNYYYYYFHYYVHAKNNVAVGVFAVVAAHIYTWNCGDYNDIWDPVVERMHRCAKVPLITGQQWAWIIFLDNIIMKTAGEIAEGGIRRVIRFFFCGTRDDSRSFCFSPPETRMIIITY